VRKTPAYTGRENPRPLAPSLSLCHGCGADQTAPRCPHCHGSAFETVPARDEYIDPFPPLTRARIGRRGPTPKPQAR
jgi:hypothetical protein